MDSYTVFNLVVIGSLPFSLSLGKMVEDAVMDVMEADGAPTDKYRVRSSPVVLCKAILNERF